MKKKFAAALGALCLSSLALAQFAPAKPAPATVSAKQWLKIDQLCGQLHRTPQTRKEGERIVAEPEKFVKGSTLEVFKVAGPKAKCCSEETRAATVGVLDLGSFEVPNAVPGCYWLRLNVPGETKKHHVPLRVTEQFDAAQCQSKEQVRVILFDAKPPKVEAVNLK